MALIASVQHKHPQLSVALVAELSSIGKSRLKSLQSGRSSLKYMEQIALETLLPSETVAKLHNKYQNVGATETFWDKYINEGERNARS